MSNGGMFGNEGPAPGGGMFPQALKHDNPRKALKDALDGKGAHLHGVSMVMAQVIDDLVERVEALEKGKDAKPV